MASRQLSLCAVCFICLVIASGHAAAAAATPEGKPSNAVTASMLQPQSDHLHHDLQGQYAGGRQPARRRPGHPALSAQRPARRQRGADENGYAIRRQSASRRAVGGVRPRTNDRRSPLRIDRQIAFRFAAYIEARSASEDCALPRRGRPSLACASGFEGRPRVPALYGFITKAWPRASCLTKSGKGRSLAKL